MSVSGEFSSDDGATPPIVLLVEEDEDTAEMYEAALGLNGFWVAQATDPEDGIAYATDLRPDAVVTELEFRGGQRGLLLAARLRGEPKTAQIPVLGVTGTDAQQLGSDVEFFSEVLTKPVAPELLVERLRVVIASSRQLQARSQHARERVPELVEHSNPLLERSVRLAEAVGPFISGPRACPRCGRPLRWSERRELGAVVYDYYHPCASGCGLFCYDHSRRGIVTLIG